MGVVKTVLATGAAASVATALLLGALSAVALAGEIGPGENLCAAIHALAPGDELVLRPGDYQGPCTIRHGGSPGAPLVIRAADLSRRPRLVYTGTETNVLNIRADHVTVRGLRFGPTLGDVDAIRIYSRQDITIEECEFSGVNGIAVVANHSSLRRLTVRRNVILDNHATAMYFGCHDGFTCEVSDILVERNYINRAGYAPEGVGYGLEIKLNSVGIVRDNIIVDTKGPPIMVYGSRSPDKVAVVERNFVAGSRQSSGIVVGGGPAIIRNNVSMSNSEAGIGVEDYGKRDLLRGIAVVHNTVYGNEAGGILTPPNGVRDVIIANNAVHSGVATLPSPRPGISLSGNMDCSRWSLCFRNPGGRDFSPGALLLGAGIPRPESWSPVDDFFGRRRGIPPTIGAIERPGPPIEMGLKPD